MSELVKTPQEFSKALRSRMKQKYGKTARTVALLMDISLSMHGEPIRQLRKLADGFKSVRRFVFSDGCYELDPEDAIDGAEGGTNMAGAFVQVKAASVNHVVLITDGQPDNWRTALRESAGLKIDVLYVGPPPPPPFLEQLATNSGGKYGAASLDDIEKLEFNIRGLLPSATDSSVKL